MIRTICFIVCLFLATAGFAQTPATSTGQQQKYEVVYDAWEEDIPMYDSLGNVYLSVTKVQKTSTFQSIPEIKEWSKTRPVLYGNEEKIVAVYELPSRRKISL